MCIWGRLCKQSNETVERNLILIFLAMFSRLPFKKLSAAVLSHNLFWFLLKYSVSCCNVCWLIYFRFYFDEEACWCNCKFKAQVYYAIYWDGENCQIICQNQNQNCLLVTRQNENHSLGPGQGRLVPSSHEKCELSNSSAPSAEEIRESGSAFQFLMVWRKKKLHL